MPLPAFVPACMHSFMAPDCNAGRSEVVMLGAVRGAWRGMQITVDGDTSTNDCVIGMTSGAAGNADITSASSTEAQALEAAVTALLQVGPAGQAGP